MSPTAIVYTTTTGNTQYVAELFHRYYKDADLLNLLEIDMNLLEGYDNFIFCVSTWGLGDMQDDWENLAPDFLKLSLRGKKAGILGLGDQRNYPQAFADGMRKMADMLKSLGVSIHGATSSEGYDFSASKAVVDRKFIGLVIDEDNQHDLTEPRLKEWANQLRREFRAR